MPKRARSQKANGKEIELGRADPIDIDRHPDYVGGVATGEGHEADLTPVPGGPLPPRPPLPTPTPPEPFPTPLPRPFPEPRPFPLPRPWPLPSFCSAVSGTYRYAPQFRPRPTPAPLPVPGSRPVVPDREPDAIIPINLLVATVRVDVDRYHPQNRISVEVSRLFPRRSAHVIAEVTSDRCVGFNRRTIDADIVYRDGDADLIPGSTLTFTARPTSGLGYGAYELTISGDGSRSRSYSLRFDSPYFDRVEFEVDCVANAGTPVTTYDTGSHPNRPTDLPDETISLVTTYQRAGFDAVMSPNASVLPTSGAGANGTWSDQEMHNAMTTYWSRFADRPQWALWVLYAARHDRGRSLGGVMFDDIGPNHRQGTAIFTDSFIQDAPTGDPDPASWRARMQYWTAVHEMGHAFNLAHSWQKALGSPVAPGDPWVPLANEPEARSFMNYPFNVSGGQGAFFSDFRFRFSDDELVFMRHAPRRFVQMGNSDWFVNHGFEQPEALRHTGSWSLEVRTNRRRKDRRRNGYQFLEPVVLELKLKNTSTSSRKVDADMLSDGLHVNVFVRRRGGRPHRWRPMITRLHETEEVELRPEESIYGAHMVSASTGGWLIDDAGFYEVQAAVDMGDEIVVSNVLRLHVAPPTADEASLAPEYFTEDVGRAIAFQGAPDLPGVEDVLRTVREVSPDNPASKHAAVALSSPKLRSYKHLVFEDSGNAMSIQARDADIDEAAAQQSEALLDDPDAAADTFGHIPYFDRLRTLAEAIEDDGDEQRAIDVMSRTIDVMDDRDILASVIDNAKRRLERRR